MRWGRVEVTGGFLLLCAWLNYMDTDLLFPMALTACILHEVGHYIVIRLLGNEVKSIHLSVIGAEMRMKGTFGYWQEIAAAFAGPAVNLLLALFFSKWVWGHTFAGLNLVLGLFNLLPISKLDGGRILYCLNALVLGPNCASDIRNFVDYIMTIFLLGSGILLAGGGNWTLLFVASWLFSMLSSRKKGNRACLIERKKVK